MECLNKLTYTKDNNGLVTWFNTNSVDALINVNPALTGFPLTVPAQGQASYNFQLNTGINGTNCFELFYTCQDEVGECSIDISNVILTPNKAEYAVGEEITYTLDITNSGNRALTDVCIELKHDTAPPSIPTLKCPSGIFTDPTNFTLEWCHDEFPAGVTQKNVDGRIIINGQTFDIGNSFVYTTPTGNMSATYDLINGPTIPLGTFPSTGSGFFTLFAYHWDNGNVALDEMPLDDNNSLTRCTVQYNFD